MLLWAFPAGAHGFGQRYDLPLPLSFYLAGAGGTVALSFVIMVLVFRGPSQGDGWPGFDLLRFRPMRAVLHPLVIAVIKAVSVGLFLLVLAAGFFGTQETYKNFAPTFIWITWWVGLAYVVALAGNFWPIINPWSILFAGLEKVVCRIGTRDQLSLDFPYPSWLGVWPAVVLFGFFSWFELIVESAKVPATLATAILVYSSITWLGMAAFGRHVWLARGEA